MWEGQTGPVLKDCICAGRTGPVQEGQDLCGKDKPWDGSIGHNWKEQEMYGSMDTTGLFGGQGQGARREV